MTDRKARLAALAARAGRTKKAPSPPPVPPPAAEENDQPDHAEEPKTVKFRNYAPQDKTLEQQPTEEEEPMWKRAKVEGKSILEEALEKAKEDVKGISETEVVAMAPKNINWDLKRDIRGKLDKLERRTQRAIVALLKERLEKEAEESTDNLE